MDINSLVKQGHIFLILVINLYLSQQHSSDSKNYYHCYKPKSYGFCGAKTMIITQWFYHSKGDKCYPYKYCISVIETTSTNLLNENRFDSESMCIYSCSRKPIDTIYSRKSIRKMKLEKKVKTVKARNYQSLPMNQIRNYKNISPEKDRQRCDKPKSYSFCGARTVPQTQWFYDNRRKICSPYNYCQPVTGDIAINTENRFYSEEQCVSTCKTVH